jgi:hypothetical protein
MAASTPQSELQFKNQVTNQWDDEHQDDDASKTDMEIKDAIPNEGANIPVDVAALDSRGNHPSSAASKQNPVNDGNTPPFRDAMLPSHRDALLLLH